MERDLCNAEMIPLRELRQEVIKRHQALDWPCTSPRRLARQHLNLPEGDGAHRRMLLNEYEGNSGLYLSAPACLHELLNCCGQAPAGNSWHFSMTTWMLAGNGDGPFDSSMDFEVFGMLVALDECREVTVMRLLLPPTSAR